MSPLLLHFLCRISPCPDVCMEGPKFSAFSFLLCPASLHSLILVCYKVTSSTSNLITVSSIQAAPQQIIWILLLSPSFQNLLLHNHQNKSKMCQLASLSRTSSQDSCHTCTSGVHVFPVPPSSTHWLSLDCPSGKPSSSLPRPFSLMVSLTRIVLIECSLWGFPSGHSA